MSAGTFAVSEGTSSRAWGLFVVVAFIVGLLIFFALVAEGLEKLGSLLDRPRVAYGAVATLIGTMVVSFIVGGWPVFFIAGAALFGLGLIWGDGPSGSQ